MTSAPVTATPRRTITACLRCLAAETACTHPHRTQYPLVTRQAVTSR